MVKIKDMSDNELATLVVEHTTVQEEVPVRNVGDCPLCWGDEASLADLRVMACPVDHSVEDYRHIWVKNEG